METKQTTNQTQEFTRAVLWNDIENCLSLVDQRLLPTTLVYVNYTDFHKVAKAIHNMTVRGAPAIGAAGAFGMALCGNASKASSCRDFMTELHQAKVVLDEARPTAVNLTWATRRLMELLQIVVDSKKDVTVKQLQEALLHEAKALAEADVDINKRLGAHGAKLIKHGANILHHCNTGRLATVDHGTALGVIYTAHEHGKDVHVWVDETRPRLQGARLTAWELMRAGVKMHLIADNAAGLLMYQKKVDIILFGADRVAANGDVANKIGTYKLGVCGRENGIPVYACVPASTIDLDIQSGQDIVIETRSSKEVTHVDSAQIAPDHCAVFNPAFDVCPARYLTGIITEEGICYPPYDISLRDAKEKAEQRIHAAWKASLEKHAATELLDADVEPAAKRLK